jgi:hypothetical protein
MVQRLNWPMQFGPRQHWHRFSEGHRLIYPVLVRDTKNKQKQKAKSTTKQTKASQKQSNNSNNNTNNTNQNIER